jgi:predicted nucleic acid-binding Zn ribbon protein
MYNQLQILSLQTFCNNKAELISCSEIAMVLLHKHAIKKKTPEIIFFSLIKLILIMSIICILE